MSPQASDLVATWQERLLLLLKTYSCSNLWMLSILNLEGYSAARCFIHILGAVQVPLIPMQYPSFLLLLLLQLLLLLRPRCLHLCFCCGGGGAAGQLHPSVFDPEKCISFICFDKVYLIHKIVFGVFDSPKCICCICFVQVLWRGWDRTASSKCRRRVVKGKWPVLLLLLLLLSYLLHPLSVFASSCVHWSVFASSMCFSHGGLV